MHVDDGASVSPRGAVLVHGGPWAARVSAGRSYAAPTPLTEETEAAGVAFLNVADDLKRENLLGVSAELSHTTRHSVFSVAVFRTTTDDPALVDRETFTLYTDDDPVITSGVEVAGLVRGGLFALSGTYAFLETEERGSFEVALTPRHSAGIVGMWEAEDVGRVGIEWYYTGQQRLDDNPYRAISEPYMILGLLAEKQVGRLRLFINGENLTAVRQTRWDPLLRPDRAADGRWTVDAWAPLEGRNINGGVRVFF